MSGPALPYSNTCGLDLLVSPALTMPYIMEEPQDAASRSGSRHYTSTSSSRNVSSFYPVSKATILTQTAAPRPILLSKPNQPCLLYNRLLGRPWPLAACRTKLGLHRRRASPSSNNGLRNKIYIPTIPILLPQLSHSDIIHLIRPVLDLHHSVPV